MDEDMQNTQSAAVRTGIDYTVKLSYAAVDNSDLADKRGLIYSLVCFGCMFDDSYAKNPDPIVRKYDCLSMPEPKKYDLYELVYAIINLPTANDESQTEITKSWYMAFAYVLLSEAPHSAEIYEKIKRILHTKENFEEVMRSRYSVYIPATTEEIAAQDAPNLIIDWYEPYIEYCRERDDRGVTRETKECKRLLALGNFNDALLRSERLLSAYPDDLQIAITNIAARVSLSGAADVNTRTALLKDTLSLIDEYINIADGQYFKYYRGLTLLGLMDTVGARAEFKSCLEADSSFELAALMLKGMDKYEK